MKLNLEKSVVVVTGGTAGIGKAIVEGFLEEGATVAYCSRKATGSEFPNYPQKAFGTAVDVTDSEALKKWIEKIATEHGGIDVLVSNVSALAIADTKENWVASFNADMQASVQLIDLCLPHLLNESGRTRHPSPNIITISSISASEVDFTAPGPYGPFKAALIHYTQSIARKYASKGLRANIVSPGTIYVADRGWGNAEKNMPEVFGKVMKRNPMGRMGKPKEIADAVLFLASPLSSFTTGSNFMVDGGFTSRIHL